jgi:glycosyltransferase involved in cell wall biosynthesis
VKIALLGGIFENPMGSYAASAPEAVLRSGLRRRGHEVIGMSVGRFPSLAEPCDVYHVHHFGVGGYALAAAGARPLVVTSHNPFLVSPFPVPESRLEHRLQGLLLRAADAVVALSHREADLLAARFGIDREAFEVIPNGLDLAHYPAAAEYGEDPPTILCVAQLVEYKGHEHLLRALARLVPAHPAVRVELVAHRFDLRDRLEALAGELGIEDRLTIAGPLATLELVERYRACSVYVQPSLAECFPITVLEAMAVGRPVVATDVGGVAEELGATGLVVPAGDEAALVDAIGGLLADADERARLGALARARVEAEYAADGVVERHVALYERLSGRRSRPGRARRLAARAAIAAYTRRGAIGRRLPRSLVQR